MGDVDPPRRAVGAYPHGGAAGGPAEPDPPRLLGWVGGLRRHVDPANASALGCIMVLLLLGSF